MTKKILAVVTARGGSKGLPGKNIKSLLGKPLIVYSIEAAKASGVCDRVIISTEDPKIAEVALSYGCEVPFMRPVELAQDGTPHLPVMQHAVQWLKDNEGYEPDYVLTLQPTSPARQPFHIREAAELLEKSDADSIMAVSEVPDHFAPSEAMTIDERGLLRLIGGRPVWQRVVRRQDLPTYHAGNGMLYLFKARLLFDKENPNFYGDKVLPYIVEDKYAVDINNQKDWERAERVLREL